MGMALVEGKGLVWHCDVCGGTWRAPSSSDPMAPLGDDQCGHCLVAKHDQFRVALQEILARCEWRPLSFRASDIRGGVGCDISGPAIAVILENHGIDPEAL